MKLTKKEIVQITPFVVYDLLRDRETRRLIGLFLSPIPMLASIFIVFIGIGTQAWDLCTIAYLLLMIGTTMLLKCSNRA